MIRLSAKQDVLMKQVTRGAQWREEVDMTALFRRKHVISDRLEEVTILGVVEVIDVDGDVRDEPQLPGDLRVWEDANTPVTE